MPDETTVTCQECNATQSFTVWQSFNVTLDRDAKQKILTGELTRFTCQKCGWSGPVAYPFRLFAEYRSFAWAAGLSAPRTSVAGLRQHLILFSMQDQGRDSRDALPGARVKNPG